MKNYGERERKTMKIHRILPTVTTTNTLTKPCAFIRSADPNAASVVETWHERNATLWVSMGSKMICHYETFFSHHIWPTATPGVAAIRILQVRKNDSRKPDHGECSPVVEQKRAPRSVLYTFSRRPFSAKLL